MLKHREQLSTYAEVTDLDALFFYNTSNTFLRLGHLDPPFFGNTSNTFLGREYLDALLFRNTSNTLLRLEYFRHSLMNIMPLELNDGKYREMLLSLSQVSILMD